MKFDIDEIKRKNEIVDNTIIQLKKEFVGIDEQIDEVMNNIRTWYLYPELQNRPVVVSIFGLTGTGKTSLIKKIAKYLDVEKDLVYFNFAEIGEMHSYEVEEKIEEELENNNANRIFVYDEFQYAATLDEDGHEKDNKSCLKPFWELMDSGLLHKRHTIWDMRVIINLIRTLIKINSVHPMEIENGKWINAEECVKMFTTREIRNFNTLLNFEYDTPSKRETEGSFKNSLKTTFEGTPIEIMDDNENKYDYFVKSEVIENIINLYLKSETNINERMKLYNEIIKKDYDELMEFLVETQNELSKGYDLKFNGSIIFVIANLDEAYDISFNVNPDMSPDQFHKISKKISIVDIKEALKKRFRNEQIARLGNIHVIYPSFSSETFRKLIDMSLEEYAKDVEEKIGVNVRYTSSIKKCIYDEAVYPTHGTRPIFSTIHELIKSKLPEVVKNIMNENILEKVSVLEYSFKNKNTVIKTYDKNNNLLSEYSFKDKLRLNVLRENKCDEQQALCGVHESGHFVIYTALTGKLPEKIVSKASETGTGGFILEKLKEDNIFSFNDIFNKLQVYLGGYVAERLVFDEGYVSSGACKDLEECTILASKAIRELGFGNAPYITTYLLSTGNPKTSGYLIRNEEEHQKLIIDLINTALENTKKILTDEHWNKMFRESCKYLSQHTNMSPKKMKEIYNVVPEEVRTKCNDRYYREIVNKL